ncbi:MAG: DUF2971 domain-containing protein [Bacteroidales bacterium]
MICKTEIEKILRIDLLKVLTTDTFYHYTKFKTAIDSILTDCTLQFSNPKTFNDPFDCNLKLLKINYKDIMVNEAIKQSSINLSRQQRREVERTFNNPKTFQNILKAEREKYKIACFSETNKEILMWSHYADKHSGVCIGFNFPHKYDDKFVMCPVKYLNELKSIDGMTDTLKVILYWLTTKSVRWDYEQEIRAVTKSKMNTNYELIKFDSKYIKEIIFGCNVTEKELNDGIKKIKKSGLNIDRIMIKHMRIDEHNFLLKEELIKTSH